MAVKERVLADIMQSRRWRENAGSSVTFPKARQTRYSFASVLTSRIVYSAFHMASYFNYL